MFVRTRRRGSYPTTLAKSLKFIILLSGKLRGSANHAWQEGTSSLRLQTVNCMPTLPTRSESCLPSRWFALIGELLFTFSRRPHVGTFTHLEFCQCRNASFQTKTGDENGYSLGNTGSQNQMQGIPSRYGRPSAFVRMCGASDVFNHSRRLREE